MIRDRPLLNEGRGLELVSVNINGGPARVKKKCRIICLYQISKAASSS